MGLDASAFPWHDKKSHTAVIMPLPHLHCFFMQGYKAHDLAHIFDGLYIFPDLVPDLILVHINIGIINMVKIKLLQMVHEIFHEPVPVHPIAGKCNRGRFQEVFWQNVCLGAGHMADLSLPRTVNDHLSKHHGPAARVFTDDPLDLVTFPYNLCNQGVEHELTSGLGEKLIDVHAKPIRIYVVKLVSGSPLLMVLRHGMSVLQHHVVNLLGDSAHDLFMPCII